MLPYGVELVSCFVKDVSVPEEDASVQQLKAALAKRAEMNVVGFNYQQERTFDVLDSAAKNESSGAASFMGAGMGLGMGLGAAGKFGAAFGDLAKNLDPSGQDPAASGARCPNCGSAVPASAKFCPECGRTLGAQCPKCGAVLTGAPKFCSECGEKL